MYYETVKAHLINFDTPGAMLVTISFHLNLLGIHL